MPMKVSALLGLGTVGKAGHWALGTVGKAGHWVLWVKAGTDDLMPMGSLLLGAPIEGGWAVHWEKQIDPRGAHFWDQSRSQLHLHCAYVSCACAIVHTYISSLYFTHF